MEIDNWMFGIGVIVLLIVGGFGGATWFSTEKEIAIPGETIYKDKIVEKIVNVPGECQECQECAVYEDGTVSDSSYILNKNEYEEEITEAKALEMALAEIDSRDFKKAVFNALEDCGVEIDSYKDITKLKVMDSDVDGNEVEIDVKVYYFLDGDEDETEKARLEEFTIEIDDLDFDDDFSEAEINEDYLDNLVVLKVYD